MNELIQENYGQATIRWKLLAGASALVLTAYVSSVPSAMAEDVSKPQVWIELGGQLEEQMGMGNTYTPPFIANNPDSPAFNPVSPVHYERPALYSLGEEGKISFQPEGSDWQFSAAIRYGRSGGRRSAIPGKQTDHVAHYTAVRFYYDYELDRYVYNPLTGQVTQHLDTFAPTQVEHSQTHAVVDFMAGRDVGLGLFGGSGSSTVSAGVRFAQFHSKISANIHARPANEVGYFYNAFIHHLFPSLPGLIPTGPNFHTYAAQFHAQRNFAGVGPSISWNASMPVVGNLDDEALTVDWGVNAAVLFGRQRASGDHQTSGHYRHGTSNSGYYSLGKSFNRSRRVTVPNVGGMVGMSLKFPHAKISVGYRGDFFFGAMDAGIDERDTRDVSFRGPFATISIGLGG